MISKSARLRVLERKIERLSRRLAELERLSNRYSWARVLIFLGGVAAVVVAYFAWGTGPFAAILLLATAAFVVTVTLHQRLERSIRRHAAWRTFAQVQMARATHDWPAIPPDVLGAPRYDHPFEADLDLVGAYSLHRLLNTALSQSGAVRLRALLADERPSSAATLQRQARVRELAPRILLRTRLDVAARTAGLGDASAPWDPAALLEWLTREAPPTPSPAGLLLLLLLAAVNLGALALSALGLIPPLWAVTLPLYVAAYFVLARNNPVVFKEASQLQAALDRLTCVFRVLESYGYAAAPHLAELCREFRDPNRRPSTALRRIAVVAAATGVQGNPVIWLLLNLAVPWDYFFALRLARLKADVAEVLPGWLDSWFELEALSSLANLGYLNPAYVMPTITAAAVRPLFHATAVGHPLLPDSVRVTNDFTIDALGEITLITGSNMAGKSTFLRTIGVNLVLAYAGAPVAAHALHSGIFRLFTCIKVSDSVTGGISYFYAEVQRLRALLHGLDAADPLPLFYLIDEIFRGTNNRERLQGSRAYVRHLVGKPGVGLISTHDLELVKLGEAFPAVRNLHFRDDVVEGRMRFDYRLRPGPCPTTNALKIMALEGLPIDL